MIVIDTSALIAIFRQEEEAAAFAARIENDTEPLISAASVLEASIVLRSAKIASGEDVEARLDNFLGISGIGVEAVTQEQAKLARRAHMQFGKRSHHPAKLNFGDCFAYALAKTRNAPLLFKGEDFARTDIVPALGRS